MAFREVTVVQVREALRRWLQGEGERPIARAAGVSRGTARRYITAAQALGVDRPSGGVAPRRCPGHRPAAGSRHLGAEARRGSAGAGCDSCRGLSESLSHPSTPSVGVHRAET